MKKIEKMSNKLTTLAVFNSTTEAQIFKIKLESEGIKCFVEENMSSVYPVGDLSIGGVKLRVLAQDFDKAKALLDGLTSESED